MIVLMIVHKASRAAILADSGPNKPITQSELCKASRDPLADLQMLPHDSACYDGCPTARRAPEGCPTGARGRLMACDSTGTT